MNSDTESSWHHYIKAFDQFVANQFTDSAPERLYEPIQYIMKQKGKRFRPLCSILGYKLFASNWINSFPVAYVVELFHNFTLLHDDIMDEADIRRGLPSAHKKFGMNAAILSGDAMLIYCFERLQQWIEDPLMSHRLSRILSENGIKVCEGQQLDIDFETRTEVDLDTYLLMIRYKTAVLVGAAFKMGALLAGSTDQEAEALYDFGVNLGVSFQIQDDLLDTYGSSRFGKKIGGDIVQNKKTILYLLALDKASQKDRAQLATWYEPTQTLSESAKIAQVTELFDRYSIPDMAKQYQEQYHQLAFEALQSISKDTREIEQFAQALFVRST